MCGHGVEAALVPVVIAAPFVNALYGQIHIMNQLSDYSY